MHRHIFGFQRVRDNTMGTSKGLRIPRLIAAGVIVVVAAVGGMTLWAMVAQVASGKSLQESMRTITSLVMDQSALLHDEISLLSHGTSQMQAFTLREPGVVEFIVDSREGAPLNVTLCTESGYYDWQEERAAGKTDARPMGFFERREGVTTLVFRKHLLAGPYAIALSHSAASGSDTHVLTSAKTLIGNVHGLHHDADE